MFMKMTGLLRKITIKNLKKSAVYLRKYGYKGTFVHFMKQYQNNDKEYEEWYEDHRLRESEINMQTKHHFAYEPLISILVPVYNTPILFLKEMVESVCRQTYSRWELCIVNASPNNLEVLNFLSVCAEKENRIRIENIKENLGIAENTNAALYMANGDYIGLLDHDDILSQDALYNVVKGINEANMPEIIYTDEDKISKDKDKHFQPCFKPDFNLDFLRSNNYICHFFVVKRKLLLEIEGFRKEYDGAQDYDLILRCVEKADNILHIPKILYHWRMHEVSTSDNPESKMYAYEAGKRAIQEHLVRCKENGKVEFTNDLGFYRVKYKVKGNPLITVIILCDQSSKEVRTCIRSIYRSTYSNFEFILIGRNIMREKIPDSIRSVNLKEKDTITTYINSVVKQARGEYLFLISGNVKLIDNRCLVELLANCQRKEVGIVGGKVYNADGKIQNAGIIVRGDHFVENVFEGMSNFCVGYMHRDSLQQNLSVVSADCMMIKYKAFETVDGFDEKAGDGFFAVDFCLKVIESGFRVVYNPNAKSGYIKKCNKKDKYSQREFEYMSKKWKKIFEKGDPAYNHNLRSKYLLK